MLTKPLLLGIMVQLLLALQWAACAEAYNYTLLGIIQTSQPAFMLIASYQGSLPYPTPSLFVSSFTGNPLGSGSVSVIENITAYFSNFSSAQPTSLGLSFSWPNVLTALPAPAQQQLGTTNAILVPDGFLVPGKSNGGLYIISQSAATAPLKRLPRATYRKAAAPTEYCITEKQSGFFYHNATWIDMNGDGRLDVLSAKATKPLFGAGSGSLVWLEQPPEGLAALPWKEHVVTPGPDVFITVLELDSKKETLEVVATEFFSSQLTLNVIGLNNGSLIYRTVIDNSIGPVYRAELASLNADGGRQLLVTNHIDDVTKSAVFAYDIPEDPTQKWTRYTLATGFPVTEKGLNQAAPGFAYACHPFVHSQAQDERPLILVAGDDSQSAYLLTPSSNTPFEYGMETVVKTGGTVGSILVTDDLNGDGLREFLVADYDENKVFVYSFTADE